MSKVEEALVYALSEAVFGMPITGDIILGEVKEVVSIIHTCINGKAM